MIGSQSLRCCDRCGAFMPEVDVPDMFQLCSVFPRSLVVTVLLLVEEGALHRTLRHAPPLSSSTSLLGLCFGYLSMIIVAWTLPGRLLPGGRYPWQLHSRSARFPAPLRQPMGSPRAREAGTPDPTIGILGHHPRLGSPENVLASGQTPLVADVPAPIAWWMDFPTSWYGSTFFPSPPVTGLVMRFATDTCGVGFGTMYGLHWFSTVLPPAFLPYHLNIVRLFAVAVMVHCWGVYWWDCQVLLHTNTLPIVLVWQSSFSFSSPRGTPTCCWPTSWGT